MTIAGFCVSLLIAVLSIIPSPYAIGTPGPTWDTLSSVPTQDGGEVPLVSIDGAPVYEASGELRLTTVSASRGTSQAFTLGRVVVGWLRSSEYVIPQEEVFGDPTEADEFERTSQLAWISSQESATVSALEALDMSVAAELTVVGLSPESNAVGHLAEGDVIVSVNGLPVPGYAALSESVAALSPGDVITVGVVREGVEHEAEFATIEGEGGRALMGILVDPIFELPIDVVVQIDSVGGPSAGLMFSLAIMDLLTPEDELQGALVAGTGAISPDGDVLPIGGIRLKMHGAVSDGSEYFLAPVENCAEVVGHIPDGLSVVAVDTLDDAYQAIRSIGAGAVEELPTC